MERGMSSGAAHHPHAEVPAQRASKHDPWTPVLPSALKSLTLRCKRSVLRGPLCGRLSMRPRSVLQDLLEWPGDRKGVAERESVGERRVGAGERQAAAGEGGRGARGE